MLAFALFVILMDSTVQVPPSHWTAIDVKVPKPRTVVECSVSVENNSSTIDALLLTREDAERFNRGRSFQPLYSTGFQSSTRFRYDIDQPGEYVLLLDNRLEGRGPTPVKVRIELWNPGAVQARTVPKERQRVVIGLSLLFFAAVVAFSARQFLK